MGNKNLVDNIKRLRIELTKRYDYDKCWTNTDEGKEMNCIHYEMLESRNVGSFGGEVDEDLYFGIDSVGWVKYYQRCRHSDGDFKIENEQIINMSDNETVEFLEKNNEILSKVRWLYQDIFKTDINN